MKTAKKSSAQKLTTEEQLEALSSKWQKAKSKQLKANAKELNLRQQIEAILAKTNQQKATVTTEYTKNVFTRNTNYSIPAAPLVDIKTHITDVTVFNSLFSTSYKIKKAAFESLDKTTATFKAIDTHLIKKPSPLSVKSTEVE